ncbi:sensor histidine kinase [Clostridium oryzae]|uniref:histidine kinase n=1 Tax=Clostridium oryzae TaxID=1450648 RepID=A0A1V4I746_9CLOT|nr:sensor histidine kinase [Clostridium oryzae]OPJ55724.1 sensor histidine kinase ComP [Clostridium oryzae]
MEKQQPIIFVRYYVIFLIIFGILLDRHTLNSISIIFILIYIINNQLRFFSFSKEIYKIGSYFLELILILVLYEKVGGYAFTYLILASIDANVIFKFPLSIIFDAVVIGEGIYFSVPETIACKMYTIGSITAIIAILLFVKQQETRKIQAQDLYDKLRVSEKKLIEANRDLESYSASIEELTVLRERNRISREIHDSVGHALSTIIIQLGALEKVSEKSNPSANSRIKNLREFTQKSLAEVRNAVREIRPEKYEEYESILELKSLIDNFKKMTGVEVRLTVTKDKWALSQKQFLTVYRIMQEFLSNSVRHGKASIIRILMNFTEYSLVIILEDNGVGTATVSKGIGLKSIEERIKEIGGSFYYNTSPDNGFLVNVEINRNEKIKIYLSNSGGAEPDGKD